jgi:ribonuclease H2 subunit A
MSPHDISAGMLKLGVLYNLNQQAMDATIELIKEVFARGVNVKEIYIDTIGPPQTYQAKLSRIFPTTAITVAKKADSLYPCVSAASVCAKVTRDAALEVCYRAYTTACPTLEGSEAPGTAAKEGWGSGYPSDPKCSAWLK